MGWTYQEQPREGQKKYLDGLLTWTRENGSTLRVLDSSIVNFREYYAAVELRTPDGTREVWAAAFMLDFRPNDPYGFGYKDMTEDMGPYIDNCPARILDLLTATDSEWANQWRARCRQKIEHRAQVSKLQPGDRFEYGGEAWELEKKRPWIAHKVGAPWSRARFTRRAKDAITV